MLRVVVLCGKIVDGDSRSTSVGCPRMRKSGHIARDSGRLARG